MQYLKNKPRHSESYRWRFLFRVICTRHVIGTWECLLLVSISLGLAASTLQPLSPGSHGLPRVLRITPFRLFLGAALTTTSSKTGPYADR